MDIDKVANLIKGDIELAITDCIVNGSNRNKSGKPFDNGAEAKDSLIRSSIHINYLHDFVKHELIRHNVSPETIFPPLHESKPEIKLTGLYKQKDQDVCVKPTNINHKKTPITWGPMAGSGLYCKYGKSLSEQILAINVRSQLSSLAKNSDTLFERTFAEALNLHAFYPKICMGEVYMIPVFEYDDGAMKENKVRFKSHRTNLEKYISFFHYRGRQ